MLKAALVLLSNIICVAIWINIPANYGGGGGFSNFITNMGLGYLDVQSLIFIFGFSALYSLVFSLFTDLVLGKSGFGAILYGTGSLISMCVSFGYFYKNYGSLQAHNIQMIALLILLPPFAAVLLLAIVGFIYTGIVSALLSTGTAERRNNLRGAGDGGPSASRLRAAGRQK